MSARRPAAKPRPSSAIYVGPAPSSSFTSTSSLATITSPTSYASSSSPTKQSSPRSAGLSPRSSQHSGSPSSRPTSLTLSPKATRLRPNHRHSSSFASSTSSSYYNVPDLPEPPSPVSSGLPSPPATASSASGSGRGMLTEENLSRLEEPPRTFSPKVQEEEEWGDGDGEGDEGDDTLRRGLRTGDGDLLKRAKSLAERNRMALDKLSSYSRLSPKPPSLHTKSSSSASTSSRPPRRVPPESGSETERESVNLSVRGSEGRPGTSRGSDGRPGTSRGSDGRPVTPVGTRKRLISAPASPGKLGTIGRSPLSSPRKRASLAFADEVGIGARGGRDSVNAALAAVANSRGVGKGRAALPREWSCRGEGPPRSAATTSGGFAYGTMRRHQTRWASEDLERDLDPPSLGREQAKRGGSAESALTATATGGRSVVGQGLKAAGLELRTRAGTVIGPRAASSMDNREEESAGRGLRSARSAYPLVGGERDGAQSSMSRHSPADGLMRESLATFQRQVGGGDLWKNAREVVKEQINAEVEGSAGMNVLDIWRRVGGDYREGMRASDELVRAVTSFLLGVGKAVKDNSGDSWHGRSVSWDESGRLSRRQFQVPRHTITTLEGHAIKA
ncbi:hypothetical protein BDZ89DRAFT_1134771 [Hymenopellis radicata]|nr:hypothetical protein BDZ89DRAFT_1134771 [Hymenopellis radicata]